MCCVLFWRSLKSLGQRDSVCIVLVSIIFVICVESFVYLVIVLLFLQCFKLVAYSMQNNITLPYVYVSIWCAVSLPSQFVGDIFSERSCISLYEQLCVWVGV